MFQAHEIKQDERGKMQEKCREESQMISLSILQPLKNYEYLTGVVDKNHLKGT